MATTRDWVGLALQEGGLAIDQGAEYMVVKLDYQIGNADTASCPGPSKRRWHQCQSVPGRSISHKGAIPAWA